MYDISSPPFPRQDFFSCIFNTLYVNTLAGTIFDNYKTRASSNSSGGLLMRNYRISKEAEMKLHEMTVNEEIRMAIQDESADRSFLTALTGKTLMSPGKNRKDGSR